MLIKLKKMIPLKDEKEENNKTYNAEDTSLLLSNDLYQDTDIKATGNEEQASVDASATGHAEMGGYGAVAPNNLGGYGAAPNDLGGRIWVVMVLQTSTWEDTVAVLQP